MDQLLFSLCADDTGLCLTAEEDNFTEAKRILETFERVSGAQLNIAKFYSFRSGWNEYRSACYEPGAWSLTKNKAKADLEGLSLDSGTYVDQIIQLGTSLHGGSEKSWGNTKIRVRIMCMRTLDGMKGRPIQRLMAADRLGTYQMHQGGAGPLSKATCFLRDQVITSSATGFKITDPSIWRWDGKEWPLDVLQEDESGMEINSQGKVDATG
ncbi:hypothetical protein R1sor_007579 [Riccia sorocarpa]|uniref:Reverse transcriptase domain-containing protein n=1 Tax=Riccia sorocarpa TaxID=122646 RepID=A0ABD3HR78_9MARC